MKLDTDLLFKYETTANEPIYHSLSLTPNVFLFTPVFLFCSEVFCGRDNVVAIGSGMDRPPKALVAEMEAAAAAATAAATTDAETETKTTPSDSDAPAEPEAAPAEPAEPASESSAAPEGGDESQE